MLTICTTHDPRTLWQNVKTFRTALTTGQCVHACYKYAFYRSLCVTRVISIASHTKSLRAMYVNVLLANQGITSHLTYQDSTSHLANQVAREAQNTIVARHTTFLRYIIPPPKAAFGHHAFITLQGVKVWAQSTCNMLYTYIAVRRDYRLPP